MKASVLLDQLRQLRRSSTISDFSEAVIAVFDSDVTRVRLSLGPLRARDPRLLKSVDVPCPQCSRPDYTEMAGMCCAICDGMKRIPLLLADALAERERVRARTRELTKIIGRLNHRRRHGR